MKLGDIPDHLEVIIKQTANRVARMHRWVVSPEDLAQEIRLWMVKNPKLAHAWFDPDDMERPIGVFKYLAYRRCQDYVRLERARATGGQASDHFLYSMTLIEELLPSVFDGDLELTHVENEDDQEKRKRKDPAEGGDWMAMKADITAALDKAHPKDVSLLRLRFANGGMKLHELAEALPNHKEKRPGVSVATAHRRVAAAIERLAEHLGGLDGLASQ